MRKLLVSVMVLAMCMAAVLPVWSSGQTDTGGSGDIDAIKQQAAASGFDWKMADGEQVTVLFNQHPYAEAIIKKIPEFESLTGIKVTYSITPEENYFDKVTTSLNSRSGTPDLFMSGAYQIWDYAVPGYIQPLDEFVNDPNLVSPEYDFGDFFDGVISSLRWDLTPGHKVGSGNLWALPLGFETNTLAYNKRIFDERGLQPPKTIEELKMLCKELQEFDGPGTYALAIRGSRNWGTIHAGYMTTYSNYGAEDFKIQNGKLVSQVNSPEAIKMTKDWVELIKLGGSPTWASYTWYQAGADLGAGKAAMLFDADCNGYFQNPPGASKEAGNIAWVHAPLPKGKTEVNANLWTWAMAINKASKHKVASWLFLQYFTSKEHIQWASTKAKLVDPPRASVFESADFQNVLDRSEGYGQAFQDSVDGTYIQFTPQPHFFETTTEWAATLQDIVSGKYSTVEEGMDALKKKMDKIVSDISVN
ncbi:sugar ABC transporter substrate-binding protein [Marispirochaeta sp.]|uniref:ABC transporter substrate-binding protein n=1 Tax=Marispirochaeta sp. TaxID=2038653 RepID=UPI0029C703A2|nr:sugar ABC transporter substrate-binding protein [Marispirochaeta sp.]